MFGVTFEIIKKMKIGEGPGLANIMDVLFNYNSISCLVGTYVISWLVSVLFYTARTRITAPLPSACR